MLLSLSLLKWEADQSEAVLARATELEKLVDTGGYAVAFSLYPTSIDQLMAVADSGNVMPPKSTWFEPKLRSGMVVHVL